MQIEEARFQDSFASGSIHFGCATGLADLGRLRSGLTGCATGLIDPGLRLPSCVMGLTRYGKQCMGKIILCVFQPLNYFCAIKLCLDGLPTDKQLFSFSHDKIS